MSDAGDESTRDKSLRMGHLATDLSFATRALRARLRDRNADFHQSINIESGGIAILNVIGLNPGISQKELAGAIVLKKSAMTKVVNHMEEQGLIERRKTGSDKRFNSLHLTPEGQKRYEGLVSKMITRQDEILSPLSSAERALFFEMMWRLIDSSDSEPRAE